MKVTETSQRERIFIKKTLVGVREGSSLNTVIFTWSIIIRRLMSTAAIPIDQEDVSCPSTPSMRPLKLKTHFLEPKDIFYLPERANASADKHRASENQTARPKKTIMSFLREKETCQRCLWNFFNDPFYFLSSLSEIYKAGRLESRPFHIISHLINY